MVQNFANVALVEVEVSVAELYKGDASDKQEHPGVVSLARGLERIVTDLITVGQVVDVVLFFPGVSPSIAREVVIVAVMK